MRRSRLAHLALVLTAAACRTGVDAGTKGGPSTERASNPPLAHAAGPGDRAAPFCLAEPDGTFTIAPAAIGSFAAAAPLRELARRCPGARPEVWQGPEDTPPALVVRSEGIVVKAVQHRLALEMNVPADLWVVSGPVAQLPGGLPMNAPFRELERAYGRGLALNGIGGTVVMFCRMPSIGFTLRADERATGALDGSSDLSRIPPDTKIYDVEIAANGSPFINLPGC